MKLQRARGAVRGIAAFALVVVAGGWWTHGFKAFTTDGAALAMAGPLPRQAPSLDLELASGGASSLQHYQGRWVLLTFMYLHCPDVCHLVTAKLQQASEQIEDLTPARLIFLSLSLDPQRDDTGTLDHHWHALGAHPGWIMAGVADQNPAELDRKLAQLGVWVDRFPDGRINHAASSFLINPAGQVTTVFRAEVTADSLVKALRHLIQP